MADAEEVRGIARSKLGAMGRMVRAECKMLARLLAADEPILAMAIGRTTGEGRWFRGRVVVATPLRLLLVGKGMLTRRERIREIPLASIRGAKAGPPGSLELELDEGPLRVSTVGPPRELAVLADAARGRRQPERFAQLDELARRKLGRVVGRVLEGSLLALAEELAPDEDVVDLAFWTGAPGGIVAVCDGRIVAIPDRGFGSGAPLSVAFVDIAEIRAEADDLVVRSGQSEHRFRDLAPDDRASVIARRVDVHVARRVPE